MLPILLALAFSGAIAAVALLGMGKRKLALAVFGLASLVMLAALFVPQ